MKYKILIYLWEMYFKWIESPLEKCSREKIISSISLPIQESIKVMDSTKNTTGNRPDIRPEVKMIELIGVIWYAWEYPGSNDHLSIFWKHSLCFYF